MVASFPLTNSLAAWDESLARAGDRSMAFARFGGPDRVNAVTKLTPDAESR